MRLIIAVAVTLLAHPANAVDLDGWCIPDDGCIGESVPFRDGRFMTCEGECTMELPRPVEGVDATMFRVTCSFDGADPYTYRSVIGSHIDDEGNVARFMFDDENGMKALEKCP